MSQAQIKIHLVCDSSVESAIEIALTNMGFQFSKEEIMEPTKGYVFQLPYYLLSISAILDILESRKEQITGSIELPDGKKYEITEEGKTQLKKKLSEDMFKKQEVVKNEPIWWTPFIPEIKDFLRAMIELMEWYPKAAGEGKAIVTRNFIFILIAIVLGMGILTYFGKVSGDSFVFVIGTLLGYIFAFLQKYLGILQNE